MDTKTSPANLRNALIIARFELSKMFMNTRGIVALIAFTLVWGLLLIYPIQSASSIMLNPAFKEFLTQLVGQNQVDKLFQWQVAELAVFWCVALYLFPMFCIAISADQFASDKRRGTFRFLSLRASRDSLFFGRFIGQMLIQLVLIGITVLATIALACLRDPALLPSAMTSGALVVLNLFIILLPFTAIMGILSLYANTPRQATIYAIILWALISIVIAVFNSQFPYIEGLQWVFPGAQLSMMINSQGLGSLSFAPIPLLQAAVLLLVGRTYMQRSAL
jgi:Cu-processing system permease protein